MILDIRIHLASFLTMSVRHNFKWPQLKNYRAQIFWKDCQHILLLMDGLNSNFQHLLLRVPRFACSCFIRLSVKNIQIFRLESLSEHLVRTYPPKLLDGLTSIFKELLLRVPIFAYSSVIRPSVCQNTCPDIS